jgi:hypothetical protein
LSSMLESESNPQSTLASHLYPAITASYISERFVLPSEGEQYEECGTTKAVISCSNPSCEYPVDLKPHDCTRPECPICWPRWAKRATRKGVEKIMNSLDLARNEINPKFSLSSVVVSVPAGLFDYDSLKKEFRRIQRYLGTNHIAAILHLWRFRDSEGNELEAIRWREYEQCPDRYVRVLSPHFHCIIMGRLANSDKFYEKTGWVYKKLGGELSRESVYNVIYYALTHTAISLDRQRKTIDYYGLIRRTRIVEEKVEWEPAMCPNCGAQLQITYMYDKIALGENVNGLTEPYFRKVVTRKWELTKSLSRMKGHRKRQQEPEGACV